MDTCAHVYVSVWMPKPC